MSYRILAAALLLFSALVAPARAALADDLGEVTRLHHAGQSDAALTRADQALATSPKDAQMRFLKSVVLADIGRTGEAQTILQQLVQEYPELAEPHNNLAAIYAAGGDYGRSRSELEETLRLKPGYAPAQENLGDVHVLLAAQSYAKALRLEPSSATLPKKLALVRQIVAAPAEPARPASAPKR
jgi:Flp pilus assembly protein TadD